MDHFSRFFGILMVFGFYFTLSVEGAGWDESCADDTECPDVTHICGTGTPKLCICGTNYFRNSANTACTDKVGLDGDCDVGESADQCSVAETECRNDGTGSKCLCKTTHYSDGTACQIQIALNGGCTSGDPDTYCADSLAECRDDSGYKCLCKVNYFETKDTTCAAQVGFAGTCDITDSAANQCSVADSECKDDGAGANKCLCKATHYTDGSACVTKLVFGATCTASDQCGVADTECRDDGAGTNKCLCKSTHYESASTCGIKIALNGGCTSGDPDTYCADSLAECRDDSGYKCLCKVNYFETKDTTCAAQVGFAGTCDITDSAANQCSVADSECKDDGAGANKCLCKATHYTDGSACVTKLVFGATCTASDQCGIADTECRDDGAGTNKCLCESTHYESASTCGIKIALNGGCTSGDPDTYCADSLAECRDDSGYKCLCKVNYFETKDTTCAAQVGFAGTCDITDSAANQCSVADSECKDDGAGANKCLCKATHYTDGSACVTKLVFGATCTASDQCGVADTECRDDGAGTNTCLCKSTHYESASTCGIKIALNDGCTSGDPDTYCADSLAECRDDSGYKCVCKSNNFVTQDTTCAAQVGLEGTCDGTDFSTDQCSVADTECKDDGAGTNKCLCKATHYSDGSGCVTKKTALNDSCDATESASDQCAVTDSECRLDGSMGKCLCKATHYVDGASCTIRRNPDAWCSATGQCVTNAECDTTDTNTCVCKADYIATPITSPTMCSSNGVVKFASLSYMYVVPILVSMMLLLR